MISEEKMKYIEKKKQECFIERPLNTYDDCLEDVNKWFIFDPNQSCHSHIIFQEFRNNFSKYPIEFQMKLLLDIYVYGINGLNQKSFNTVLRKIYNAESKEFKAKRTERIRNFLMSLELINVDSNGTEYVNVFRGVNCQSAPNNVAISWTHNIDIANKFANRFAILHKDDKCCKVYKGKIRVSDIVDVNEDRDEDEIVAFPKKVYDIDELEDFVADYTGNGSMKQIS